MTIHSPSVEAAPRPQRRRVGPLPLLGWWLMTLLSLGVAVVSLRFLFLGPEALYPPSESSPDTAGISEHFVFLLEERWLRFAGHFLFGPIALILGPFQFSKALRSRRPALHRRSGWVYAVAVAFAGLAGLVLSPGAYGGLTTAFGFGTLAVLWLGATGMAVWYARHRRLEQHRQWMTRSFAMTFAAVTLRLYIPLLAMQGHPFEQIYQTVAWLSWVPNLIVAEMLFVHRPKRTAAASSGRRW